MHLFPQTGFDQSATTSVFLGVLVSWFFTETLGWVFVGLVVPGYLASLFLLDARSASIDVAEAALSYGVAHVFGELLSRIGWTSRAFGRERFLLVLVVSVLVRLGVEAVALPQLAPRATWAYSIGLVVVPLLANACWKTGLLSGFVQRGVPTLIVYLLLRFVLLPHTNLSLGGFYLATENVASSFLASPRAYLLLLTGATLAAAANVRWGWDYNGILVPGLLSLTLGGPQRLLLTFAESLLLVWAVRLLLRVTRVGRWNMEGPRRPVLYFSLDYALRFALAGAGATFLSSAGATDLMGFGYLLPTLLAVKISQLGLAAPVSLPTASVSTAAYLVATLFGFTAQKISGASGGVTLSRQVGQAPAALPLAALWASSLARSTPRHGLVLDSALDFAELAEAALERARTGVASAPTNQLETQRLGSGGLLVRERFQSAELRSGKPSILFRLDSPRPKTLLVVSRPLTAPLSALVAGRLLSLHQVDAVVIAGIEAAKPADASQALEIARRLGRRVAGERDGGLVLTLSMTTDAEPGLRARGRAAADTRLAALSAILAGPKMVALKPDRPPADVDADFELPEALAEAFVAADLPPATGARPLAISLDALRCGTQAGLQTQTVEGGLALRRLLLDPLLTRRAPSSLALLNASAAALGFGPPTRARLAAGDEAVVLAGPEGSGESALIARLQPGSGSILELPRGSSPALRRLGLSLFAALDADAAIIGPCTEREARDNALYQVAHHEAALAAGAAATTFVELRSAPSTDPAAGTQLGTWGKAEPLASEIELALRGFGLDVKRAPLDRTAREVAGDDLIAGTALVSVSVSPAELRDDAWRGEAATLRSWSWLEQSDQEPVRTAQELAASLERWSVAPPLLLHVARRAALEQSSVAQNSLRELLAGGQARAAVARSINGPLLVVVGRTAGALLVGSFPLLRAGAENADQQAETLSLSECALVLTSGGVCSVKGAE